jgi:hypothetical protein
MRNRRTAARKSGGGGGIVAGILVAGILAGLVWFAFHQMNKAREVPAEPAGPRVTLLNWCNRCSLRGADANAIPDPLPDPWLIRLESTRRHRTPAGVEYPLAWVDIQYEGGRFTAMTVSKYRAIENESPPFELLWEKEFAGLEAGKISEFVGRLGSKDERAQAEGETFSFKLFAWRDPEGKGLRSALACAARKGRPAAEQMLARVMADWASGGR